jgi:glycosidase
MEPFEDGAWWMASAPVPPGEHGYLIDEGGVRRLDSYNPLTTYRGAEEVSLLVAPDCGSPALRVDSVAGSEAGNIALKATFLARPDGRALDPASVSASIEGGPALSIITKASAEDGVIEARASGLERGKYTVVIEAADAEGRRAEAARAAVWVKPAMEKFEDGLLYHLMIDRFLGDGGAALPPPKTLTSRAGGTLSGVRSALESGYFDDLGVTALWLSPVYQNPVEPREGRDGHMSEGYHGYWPLDSRGVDPRIGGRDALVDLVRAAHARGLRVLLDLVPNHVYEANPRFVENAASGWFHDGPDQCVCGTPGCGWGERIQTCWFTSYLPDIRWEHPDAMRAGVEDALFWSSQFDLDGFRIDAVPMIPRAATRRIAAALRASAAPRSASLLLGEVFTGEGTGGVQSIRYHLGEAGLDSAFDFPSMWAMRKVVAAGAGGFDELERVLAEEEATYAGSGSVMSRIIGNHDTTRFLSEANGDAWSDPWSTPPVQPSDPAVYARHRIAIALLLTLPGMPTMYYGDEVALAGGPDPDSRRVMPSLSSLSPEQGETLDVARRLGKLRACSSDLRRGDRVLLVATSHTYAFTRDAGVGSPVIALFSTADEPSSIPVFETAAPPGLYIDVMTGAEVPVGVSGAPAAVDVPPKSFRVLVGAASPCR